MSGNSVQYYSGVDSVRAADELYKAIMARRDEWPYPHVYPPPKAEDVHVITTLAVPAPAAGATEILKYQVNSGKLFYLRAVLFTVPGQNFNPGDATFTLDRNSPIGVTSSQFMPEHGLVAVPVQLGSTATQQWYLQRAREFAPLDVVRIKATNVNLGGGTYVVGIFGYEVPVLDVRPAK